MNIHLKAGEFEISTFGLGALVLCVALWWYFGVYERPVVNEDSPNTVVVAFGDSLIEGVGAKQKGGFVTLLEEDLNIEIVNLGVSGDTVQDGWVRIDDVLRLNPRVVIISLGGNDFLKRQKQDDVEARYERIISAIHKKGGAVIVLGVPGYWNMHRDLAQKYDTAYVPNILSGLLGKDDYMFDSIHPNDTGYKKVADKVSPVLRRLLR